MRISVYQLVPLSTTWIDFIWPFWHPGKKFEKTTPNTGSVPTALGANLGANSFLTEEPVHHTGRLLVAAVDGTRNDIVTTGLAWPSRRETTTGSVPEAISADA